MNQLLPVLALSLAALPGQAIAQSAADEAAVPPQQDGGDMDPMDAAMAEAMEEISDVMADDADMAMDSPGAAMAMEIVVTGTRLRPRFTAPGSGAILGGEDLAREIRPTLGETLARLPGISSTAFGPGVSRPVLRGFQGERTRLLVDGIQSLDVSNTSPDHAVAINPLVADRIEVLRGTNALLYASGTVGGVVNTQIGRLARRLPDDGFDAIVSGAYGSAADDYMFGGRADLAVGQLVLHVDGHYLEAGLLDVGGFVLGPQQRAEALASPDAGVRALAGLRGRLPNSSVRTWDLAGAASLITDNAKLSVSLAHAESLYGLPTRYSFDAANPVANTTIDLFQTRVDARGEFEIGSSWIDQLRFRLGVADYAHDELLDNGSVIATFLNQAFEARAEIAGATRGVWRPTTGIQVTFRDFRVVGDAPLLPPNETTQVATFSVHEFNLDPVRIEAGWRIERTEVSARTDPILLNAASDREFTSISGSAGASWKFAPGWLLAVNGQYSERAPVAEELYTQGTDPGTQGVLLGNDQLGQERSWGVEAVLRSFGSSWSVEGAVHYSRFPNYIFAAQTGAIVDALPVFQFTAAGADYFGFEVQGKVDLATLDAATFSVDALADYSQATLTDGGGPVPRIPPFRLLGAMGLRAPGLTARVEVEWTSRQDRVGAFETPTDDHLLVSASASWQPLGEDHGLTVMVQGNNLFDATARRHASFLKDFAPIAGRDIRISARWSF